jgi:hypothetical protein
MLLLLPLRLGLLTLMLVVGHPVQLLLLLVMKVEGGGHQFPRHSQPALAHPVLVAPLQPPQMQLFGPNDEQTALLLLMLSQQPLIAAAVVDIAAAPPAPLLAA